MTRPASDVMTFGSAKEQDVWNRFYPKPTSDTSQVKDASKVNAITSAAEDIDKTGQAPPVGYNTSTPSEGGAGGVDWDAIESALSSTLNPRNPYGGAGRTSADVGGMLSNLQTWYGGLSPEVSAQYGPNLASAIQNVGGIYGTPTEFIGNVERRAEELYGTPTTNSSTTTPLWNTVNYSGGGAGMPVPITLQSLALQGIDYRTLTADQLRRMGVQGLPQGYLAEAPAEARAGYGADPLMTSPVYSGVRAYMRSKGEL